MLHNKKTLLPVFFATLLALTGCGGKGKTHGPIEDSAGLLPEIKYSGNLDIMAYIQGAGGTTIKDIGNAHYSTEDLTDGGIQRYHAVAKEFNKFFPDISVNLNITNIDDFDNYVTQYQQSHNMHLPHLMHLPTAPQEGLNKGYNANIAKYDYLKLYKAINPAVLDLFTCGDFVTAVPFYIYPTGMFINKTLLERAFYETDNLLDKWTIHELIDVLLPAVHNPQNLVGGTAVLSSDMIDIVSETIDKTLLSSDRRVTLNTYDVQELIDLEEKMAQYSVCSYSGGSGASVKPEYDSVVKGYNYNTVFTQNDIYAIEMARSFCLTLYSNLIEKANRVGEFDFYPFPKLNEDGDNRLGLIAEGLVVGNQCPIVNGKEQCTQNDKDAEEAAAVFALFLAADTRAAKAMATTKWVYGLSDTEKVVLTGNYETLPVIRRDIVYPYNETVTENYDETTMTDPDATQTDYDVQMGYYRTMTSSFSGQEGFEEVLRIYEEEFTKNVYAYNTIPRSIPTETGGTKDVMDSWKNRYNNPDVKLGTTGWASYIKSKLSDWEKDINANIETTYNFLQGNVDMYYGKGKYNVIK